MPMSSRVSSEGSSSMWMERFSSFSLNCRGSGRRALGTSSSKAGRSMKMQRRQNTGARIQYIFILSCLLPPVSWLLLNAIKYILAAIDRRVAELFLGADELVVLGNTVGAGEGAGLDLARVRGNGKVCDGGVLALSGAVGHDRGVPCPLRHFDGIQGLGEGADLVEFNQDGIADALLDAFFEDGRVRHEDVVPYELDLFAEVVGQKLPAFPVLLRHAVLDGDDGVLPGPVLVELDHLFR